MKKGWIALCLVGLMIALSYCLPQWMLEECYEEMNRVHLSQDLSSQLNITQETDLIGKLSILTDENAVIAGVTVTDAQADQIYEQFLEELDELVACGYQSIPIDAKEFNGNYSVFERVYIDQTRVMRAYVINAETAFAIVDKQSRRILQIGSAVAPLERISDALHMADDAELLCVKTLRAFAAYYGLKIGAVTWSEEYIFGSDAGAIISGCLSDQNGESVNFGLHLDESVGFCFIGSIKSDADLMQVGEEADTPE